MSVVKINALRVPEGTGTELEARFAARKHSVDSEPGFEGFQLLRPTGGESRYFVITTWATEEDFQAWRGKRTPHAPAGAGSPTLTTQSELLEFEVVDLAD
ncbi:antibiotic biosynthesis monooxygenase family protein [Humibacter albus]|uniref:antibiotic biosynthesis monooxygenase family protein n=1 Tax=Humibacter albus TaxID=427754 RepID=UPI0003B5C0B7|nr:antibiotic biosynthesis monooxygenase [Humibacter albus]